jgi:hypothetical protein
MRNERGVAIRMTAARAGLSLSIAPSGMTISAIRADDD